MPSTNSREITFEKIFYKIQSLQVELLKRTKYRICWKGPESSRSPGGPGDFRVRGPVDRDTDGTFVPETARHVFGRVPGESVAAVVRRRSGYFRVKRLFCVQ